MITWLQGATSKHHRLIFSFLLVVIVGSFVFYGYGNRGAADTNTRMYLGYDLNSAKLQNRYRDSLSFSSFSGQRNEGRSYFQYVAELSLADSLRIPNPSDSEVRKLALLATAGPDGKENMEGLGKFIDYASKALNASDAETRARFESYLQDAWRVNKAVALLSGPGHATTAQIKRLIQREKTLWTVDAATFVGANFKATVADDEAKAKAAFEASKESYRVPAKVEVTVVSFTKTEPDTSNITDDDIVLEGYNVAEKFKFEPGKVKEQALARRADIEKLIRADRALRNLAGKVGEELGDKFPTDAHKADSKAFADWLKAQGATFTPVATFDVNNPPAVAKVPAEALRLAGELTDKEWRTDMFRAEDAAVFVMLKKRTESRLPAFEEVKALALSNWRASERSRLMAEELARITKRLQDDAAAGKSFTESAKALGLTTSTPAPFTVTTTPDNLAGVNESTGQVLEVAGVGKITAGIRTANGDTVFLRAAKAEKPKDDATAEEVKQLVSRFTQRNAYFTAQGLVQELTEVPEEKK
jgi:hypothetical protein